MKEKKHIYAVSIGLAVAVIAAVSYLASGRFAGKHSAPIGDSGKELRGLALTSKEWTGDFDKMLEYRRIRVLLPPGRTLYFNDRGRERGLMGETIRDFEHYLNRKYARKLGSRPLTVFIVPYTRDSLLPGVAGGLGDIAAGSLTATDARLKTVDFVSPAGLPPVSEILVTGPNSPAVRGIDDLAGRTVHVRRSSSYYDSLLSLNKRLSGGFLPWNRKAPVKIALVPDALEDEDLLEMLNAGLFEFLIIDAWMAKIWGQILPGIKIREDIVLRSGGRVGWAIRRGSPMLENEIQDFYKNYIRKHGIRETRLVQFHKRIRQISNPRSTEEWKRFERTLALFEKYGHQYRFDPLMLAAQGYQESTLDQSKRSPVGAIGIMQIMPATGESLKVGNIIEIEPNIHAGARYMDLIMARYFPDQSFTEQERTLFAFASYNAGPGKISKMRELARQRGLDPNRWFNHVEVVTAEKVGLQTPTYVRNIYKYYVAYKLMLRHGEEKRSARERMSPDEDRRK